MNNINFSIEGKKKSVGFDAHLLNVAYINEALNKGAYDYYKSIGLTYVDVPEIVGITGACENVDTLFKVQNRLGIPLFFAQTGQLSLEQALQTLPGAFTVIHSGRDEEEEDSRHLRQFRLTEEEFGCGIEGMNRKTYDEDKMYEALLKHIQSAVQSMLKVVLKQYGSVLKTEYKRNIIKLEEATHMNFLRINYEDAVKLLNKNGFPKVAFGDDLKAEHEAKIVALLNKGKELPVFIMKYPKEIKFFNMKVSTKDPRVVLSADCIFPYAGEGTGSAVREHNFEKLNNRLLTSTMYRLHTERGGTYQDFKWYLDIIKAQKSLPHAGYGIGNERVLQYIFGESDIRNTALFSLLNRQTGDWDKKHYGEAAIITPKQKHILLTIGRAEKKQQLLSHIKKLSKVPNVILYATRHTHEFLKKNKVRTSLVYKISEIGKHPNIAELISKRVFDIIINIPTEVKKLPIKEFSDGKLIRKGAVDMGVSLVTDVEVAIMVIDNLAKTN